jgi:uncharacterized protein YbjT (DUF2867 family)
MFVITGVTGKVGGQIARMLLSRGLPVRAVVRDAAKGAPWKAKGCEVAVSDMHDAGGLERAFAGARAVFVFGPPNFDPSPGFPETRSVANALRAAIISARPGQVVCLSSVGAQVSDRSHLLNQLGILEDTLEAVSVPVTFLRPAWFMENALWDIEPARQLGTISSYLQPTRRAIPMVATEDVARTAVNLLLETSPIDQRRVELEGPRLVSPDDIAAALSRILERNVTATAVPRHNWESEFLAQGMRDPISRMQMLDGFNEGWIEFEAPSKVLRGAVDVETVLERMVASVAPQLG